MPQSFSSARSCCQPGSMQQSKLSWKAALMQALS